MRLAQPSCPSAEGRGSLGVWLLPAEGRLGYLPWMTRWTLMASLGADQYGTGDAAAAGGGAGQPAMGG